MRQALLWGLVVTCLLVPATSAATERNGEFLIGGYGGWAFHAYTTGRFNWAITPVALEPVDARARGIRFGN
jgi:hypothetical protein